MRIGFLFGWCFFAVSLFLNGQINAATIGLSKTNLYVGEELQITVQPEHAGNEIAVYLLAKDDFDETMKRHLCEYLPGRIHGYQTVTHRSAAGTFTIQAGPRLGDIYVIVNEFDQTTQDVICSGAQALAHHMGFSCENIVLPGCLNGFAQFTVSVPPLVPDYSCYDTHQSFTVDWSHCEYQIAGRLYQPNGSQSWQMWCDSRPYDNLPAHMGWRQITYTYINNPDECPTGEEVTCQTTRHEFETWLTRSETEQAIVFQYGGLTPEDTPFFYSSQAECQSNSHVGIAYPGITMGSGSRLDVTPQSRKKDGVCLPSITDDPVNGGYIASYLTEWWDTPFSEIRTRRCGKFFDPDLYPEAHTVCLEAPHVGVVYQRYGFPDVAVGSFGLGTEAVIYVWGYTRDPENHYRHWLRNGELRFSIYLNLTSWDGNSQYRSPHDHAWWNWGGKNAWTAKTNLIYTDIYKLNTTRYEPQ